MPNPERVFYTSSSGDQWLLNYDNAALSVRHQPNEASGGTGRLLELGAFLMLEQHSAQNQALRTLIATLITEAPVSTGEQAVQSYDQQAARDGLVERFGEN
jgi:hypothetical protein